MGHGAAILAGRSILYAYQKQDGDTVRIAIKKQDGKPAVLAAVRFTA